MLRVLWINNAGGGFADYVDVEDGTSVAQFIGKRFFYACPADYLIRVNRQPVASDQILSDGDRVTCTPLKIEGATGPAVD